MNNLLDVKQGVYCTINQISEYSSPQIKRRLLDLGFTHGQKVRIIGQSLLKKAYLIELRGYILTLRKDIVSYILIEK